MFYEYNVYTYIKLTCKYPTSTTCSTMHSLESPHDQPYHYLSYVTFSGFKKSKYPGSKRVIMHY